jgi:hypothetical protein
VIFQFKTFPSSFSTKENVVTVGTRIGDSAIDLGFTATKLL